MLNLSVLQLNVDLWDLQFATLLLFTFHTPSQLFKCGIVDCVDKGNTHKKRKLISSYFHKKKRTCSEGPFLHPYIFSFTRTRKSHDRCACSAIQLKYHSSLLWCSVYIAWHSNSLTYLPLRTTGQLHTASAHFVCSNPEILPSSQTE